MSPPGERPTGELIAELCDGMIQPEDLARLEDLLYDDPILQHEYLDQAMIEGLLRYEFGVERPSIPNQFASESSRIRLRKLAAKSLGAFMLVLICCGGYWWFRPDSHAEITVKLANLSFEDDLPISTEPILNGWYGDVARVVHGSEDNLAPHGHRMLQLIRSVHQPANECEVYHVLDLRQHRHEHRRRPAFVEATVVVNTRSDVSKTPYVISLELYTYTELPKIWQTLAPDALSNNVMVSGNTIAADSDPNSWQEIKLMMPLIPDKNFGIIKISVADRSSSAENVFSEVFVDNVQVRMTNKGLF